MKKKIYRSLLMFLVLIHATHCGDTKTGNPSAKVNLQIKGTKPGDLGALSAAGAAINLEVTDKNGNIVGQLNITEARVGLAEIEFKSEGGGGENEVDFEGPYLVDLLSNETTPSLNDIKLEPGTYTEISLKLDKLEDDDEDENGDPLVNPSDPLYENSIYIEGTYTGDTASGMQNNIPFKMSFDLDEEFELVPQDNNSEGMSINAGVENNIIIAFRLAKWMLFGNAETNNEDVGFDEVVLDGGEIILDESASGVNDDLRDVIRENIKFSADYGKDKDHNGELDSDEDEDDDDSEDD